MDLIRALLSRLSWRLLLYWGALLGGLWLFIELAEEVYTKAGFPFDEPILSFFHGLVSPPLTALARALSLLGGAQGMTLLSALVILGLWRPAKREAVFFAFSMTGAALLMTLGKYAFGRPRPELFPDVNYWKAAMPSFPSGHALVSTAFFLSVYLVASRLSPRRRLLVAALGVPLVLGIGASRLYLQVHYPSDILAGLALGAAWVLGVNAVYRYYARDRSRRTVLLTLPAEVVAAYRETARREGMDEGEVVARALRAQFSLRCKRERRDTA